MKKNLYSLLFCIALCSRFLSYSQTPEPVVGWSSWFDWTNRTADQGIGANIGVSVLNTTGGAGTPTFTDADGTGQRAMADGWAGGANTKAWAFSFSTIKYNTLRFAGKLMGTNSPGTFLGPRDFKLQYSLNNSTWTDVAGGAMTAYNGMAGWNSYSNIALPAACDNQPTVYLRLLMTSNVAVNGGTVGTGQSHFDDVNVTGISVPEAPTDIILSNRSVLLPTAGASTTPGTAIGTLSSVDFNLGNTHTYSLAAGVGSTHNSSFSVSGTTLSAGAALGAGTYSIRLRSTDNAGLTFEKVFSILVSAPDAILKGSRERVSAMGTDGATAFGASSPAAVAYNRTNNEYLVVWQGDDNTAPLVDNEQEIFAQRLNAGTGAAVGSRIRISTMGPDGNTTHKGINPSVAWNATDNEYFVVWQGDHNTGGVIAGEDEIWGQRISGATGALTGSMVRISAMEPDGNASFDALSPDVVWSAAGNQYLVVWRADDNTAPQIDNEYDIYAQRVTNTGALSGARIQVSSMGTVAGNTTYTAAAPAVTWNATNNEFMVVWQGDDNTAPLVDNEIEIFAQRISATGTLTGSRTRVSSMGPDGNTSFTGTSPDVAWNSHANEYLVVWRGDDNTAPLVDNEFEVYGQRLNSTGGLTGSRIRISDMGPDGITSFSAGNPKLMYHANLREYWVVWSGDDDATSIDNENEIFMQRLAASGAETGNNDIRVSYMGTASATTFTAQLPAIVYNSYNVSAFSVWQGDDNTAPLVDNEMEIFGQQLYITPSTLPLNWLSFGAEKQTNGSVLLTWETAQERNSRHFVVQHRGNNGEWKVIDTVAANNTNTNSRYATVHQSPLKGTNYYRLLQADLDGRTSYSKVVSVHTNGNKLRLYPNPVAGQLNVQLPSPSAAVIKIYTASGVLVRQTQTSGPRFSTSLQNLPSGLYSILVLQDDTSYQQSFLKE